MKVNYPTPELQTVLALWFVAFGSLAQAADPKPLPLAHDEYLYMIRFSPDGKTLATAAGDNVARVWSWSTHELLHTFEHDAAVYAAVFSPSEDLIATGSGDGSVSLWNATTGKLIVRQQEHADAVYCLSFAPDGRRLASVGGDGRKGDTQCRVWSVPSLEVEKILPGHDRPTYGVLLGSRQSKSHPLVTAGGDRLIHIYAQSSSDRLTLEGHTSDVYRCCLSPDAKQLASTSQDGSVRLWDVATGKQVRTLFKGKDPTYDVTYSRNGAVLAAVADDGFVRFWSTKAYELLRELKADNEGLYSVVFTPDQSCVLTGGVRGKVFACPSPQLDAE